MAHGLVERKAMPSGDLVTFVTATADSSFRFANVC